SHSQWKTIAYHSQEVAQEAESICTALGLPDEMKKLLDIAARWHDVGKAHPAFQGMLRESDAGKRPDRQDLAKGPKKAWPVKKRDLYRYLDDSEQRKGFRHELASALALFAVLRQFDPQHDAL